MSALAVTICDNETSRRGAGHTADGSNPEIAYTIGGLRVSVPKPAPSLAGILCRPWDGRPSEYQPHALQLLERVLDHALPWTYVVTTCGTPKCATESHLAARHARRIAYPTGVCIYCGLPGFTKDHLLPVTVTGEAVRQFVAVVPACKECNSAIGDRVGYRVTLRREAAHEHIAKKYRKYLDLKIRWTSAELKQLGPLLRSSVERGLSMGEVAQARLEWPHDPDYDRRAFEKSGFEDPIAMELL